MDEVYHHALKLLGRRDYTESQLREKLISKFGDAPPQVFELLRTRRFVDDRRFAENFAAKHADHHPEWVCSALEEAGVAAAIASEAIAGRVWPSLRDVANARMGVLRLHPPLKRRELTRLFRVLGRLGYPEDEIQEELERLHDQ